MPLLTADDIDHLDAADIAAAAARDRWLRRARTRPISRGKQIPPDAGDWEILLFRAGRGFGKTISEVEWEWWELWSYPNLIGHAVAPTHSDLRTVLFEGPAGFCSTIPKECLRGASIERAYNKGTHELFLANGSKILGFSATENAERLRGPQCHLMIGDEIAGWDKPKGNLEAALNVALLGLRLPHPAGKPARAVLGTTPKPIPFLKRLERRPFIKVVHGTSYENMTNLSPAFRNRLLALAGTTIGRQEIDAAYVDEEAPTAILKRPWIRLWPKDRPLPEFSFILESYDTALSEEEWSDKKQETDPTACTILGVFNLAAQFTDLERRKMQVRGRYGALVIDCWAERLGFPDLLDRARKQHKVRYGPMKKKSDLVLVEDQANGASLRQSLHVYGVPCWPFKVGGMDKVQRGHAASPLVRQGLLWVPESRSPDRAGLPMTWLEPWLEEVCAFSGPGSTEHDDQFDTLTQGLLYLRDRGMLTVEFDEKTIDREEKIAMDRDEAERIVNSEKAKERRNPYAA